MAEQGLPGYVELIVKTGALGWRQKLERPWRGAWRSAADSRCALRVRLANRVLGAGVWTKFFSFTPVAHV